MIDDIYNIYLLCTILFLYFIFAYFCSFIYLFPISVWGSYV